MRKIFFLTLILSGSSVNSKVNKEWFESFSTNTQVPSIEIIGVLPKNCGKLFTFVKDQFSTIYLVKQYKEFGWGQQYLFMVMERLVSHMAQEMGYPYNKVRIIPANSNFTGKSQKHLPATLHKVVPGVPVNQLRIGSRFANVNLKQHKAKTGISGLREENTVHLWKHPDLPTIAGFDTFVCDRDRGRGDLIFCEIKNRFYAVDFERSFKSSLAFFTLKNLGSLAFFTLKNLRNMRRSFSKEELRGLQGYKKTIEQLIKAFPPERTIQLFDKFCKEVLPGELFENGRIQGRICKYKKVILKSYEDSKQLVGLLNQILEEMRIQVS